MSGWTNGRYAISWIEAGRRLIDELYRKGLEASDEQEDKTVTSLMTARITDAAPLNLLRVAIGHASFQPNSDKYEAYLREPDPGLELAEECVRAGHATRFPQGERDQVWSLQMIVKAEVEATGGSTTLANFDKYMRGFRIAGLIDQRRSGFRNSLKYRVTELGLNFATLVEDRTAKEI